MKISIDINEKVNIKFKGKLNMSQEIVLSKEDAKKLGEMLMSGSSDSFETI